MYSCVRTVGSSICERSRRDAASRKHCSCFFAEGRMGSCTFFFNLSSTSRMIRTSIQLLDLYNIHTETSFHFNFCPEFVYSYFVL